MNEKDEEKCTSIQNKKTKNQRTTNKKTKNEMKKKNNGKRTGTKEKKNNRGVVQEKILEMRCTAQT